MKRPLSNRADTERGRHPRPVRPVTLPPGCTRDGEPAVQPALIALLRDLEPITVCPPPARHRIRQRVLAELIDQPGDLPTCEGISPGHCS